MNLQRTDLALEAHETAPKNKENKTDGVIYNVEKGKYPVTSIEIISPEGERATGKPMGTYLTVNIECCEENELETICTQIAGLIKRVAKNATKILTVGLGNTNVTADAIGPKSVNHLLITHHLKDNEIFGDLADMASISPGVAAQTGIETSKTVACLVKETMPDAVIAIDALASRDIKKLGKIIQISDTGIVPGSGVGNRRHELSEKTLGVPVIAIGVPTVVDALTLAANILGTAKDKKEIQNAEEFENMFVTPKDCDKIVAFTAKVIGYSINMAFNEKISFNEMISLTS